MRDAIKRQFSFTEVRYRGFAKDNAQIVTLFALSSLWMARKALSTLDGQVHVTSTNWTEG